MATRLTLNAAGPWGTFDVDMDQLIQEHGVIPLSPTNTATAEQMGVVGALSIGSPAIPIPVPRKPNAMRRAAAITVKQTRSPPAAAAAGVAAAAGAGAAAAAGTGNDDDVPAISINGEKVYPRNIFMNPYTPGAMAYNERRRQQEQAAAAQAAAGDRQMRLGTDVWNEASYKQLCLAGRGSEFVWQYNDDEIYIIKGMSSSVGAYCKSKDEMTFEVTSVLKALEGESPYPIGFKGTITGVNANVLTAAVPLLAMSTFVPKKARKKKKMVTFYCEPDDDDYDDPHEKNRMNHLSNFHNSRHGSSWYSKSK